MSERSSRITLIPGQSSHTFELGIAQLSRKSFLGDGEMQMINDNPINKTTTFATGMNFVTTMVGAGVLGFPQLFAMAGWYFAPVILVAMGLMVMEIGFVLSRSLLMIEDHVEAGAKYSFGKRPFKYEDMAEAAFGNMGKTVVSIGVNLFMLLMCGAFTVLIGMSFEFLTETILPYRLWVGGFAVLLIPMTLMNDMSLISRLAFIGVVASVGYVVCVTVGSIQTITQRDKYAAAGFEPVEYRMRPAEITHLGVVLSVMLLGFTCQVVVPTVRAEMEKPRELPIAIKGSVSVVFLVYLCVGICGFFAWGVKVSDNVTVSMITPDKKPMWAGWLLCIMVIANLIVTFPIIMNCVVKAAEAEMTGGRYSMPLRMCIHVAAVSVGLFCPYFLPILGLIASVLAVTMGVFVPLAVFWRLQSSPRLTPDNDAERAAGQELSQTEGTEEPETQHVETEDRSKISDKITEGEHLPLCLSAVIHSIITIAGIAAMIFGTIQSLSDIKGATRNPGGHPINDFFCPLAIDPLLRWRCTGYCSVCPA